jgi:NADP-dependent 3-hydroxy acid dehydrogenase YdfG
MITGATSGIGRATAEVFAREGHRVLITGRRTERLHEIEKYLQESYGADVLTRAFDVSNVEAVQNALENLPEGWRDIDLLINNAGGAKGLDPIHEGRIDHWETMIDSNIKGLLYVTRFVSPGMVKRRKGHILNICSTAGKETYPNGNVYSATKFAVEALTRAMRMDLYTYNIRVSQVSPGHVEETEFALNRFDGDAERAQIYKDFQPLKSSDVAEVIYFIATRPAHVNIQDVLMMGTQQASSLLIDRSGR